MLNFGGVKGQTKTQKKKQENTDFFPMKLGGELCSKEFTNAIREERSPTKIPFLTWKPPVPLGLHFPVPRSNMRLPRARQILGGLWLLCEPLKLETDTLPETNIAPTNGWLEYYFPIGEAYFQRLR